MSCTISCTTSCTTVDTPLLTFPLLRYGPIERRRILPARLSMRLGGLEAFRPAKALLSEDQATVRWGERVASPLSGFSARLPLVGIVPIGW